MPNFSNLISSNAASGFKNYLSSTFNALIPSQILAVGGYTSVTASTNLNNDNSISQIQINWGGLDTFYRILYGNVIGYYSAGGLIYSIQSNYYFDATKLYVATYVVNQDIAAVTIPNITVNCRGFLFLAPF